MIKESKTQKILFDILPFYLFFCSRPTRGSRATFTANSSSSDATAQEDAVKKFGSAKAISSDMYFGNQGNVS